MTSGTFTYLPVNDIQIDRTIRQRKELLDIPALAKSIADNGLINPIVVTRDNTIVAGERRLAAHKLLGYETIAAQFTDEIDAFALHILELEENVQRLDLTWQEQTEAVATYHTMKLTIEPAWTTEKTGEALHRDPSWIGRQLMVKKAIDEGVQEVIDAPKFSTAMNFAQRRQERQTATATRELLKDISGVKTSASDEAEETSESEVPLAPLKPMALEQADFLEWSKIVREEPFNLLHVDFPYGVNTGDKGTKGSPGQSARKLFGGYDDSKEIYDVLCDAFVTNLDNFCAPSAHLMFWFSMDYYQETLDLLRAADWRVDPFPLIWFKSDNTGILPDPNRGPRRVYETCFFASRGDRKIVRATGNATSSSTPPKDEKRHMSQKSRPMLEHFFRMVTDESTRMLDPTCGSGVAVGIAEGLGAEYSLGLELNQQYVDEAKEAFGL